MNKLISTNIPLYAHTKRNSVETIQEHSDNVLAIFNNLNNEKDILGKVRYILTNLNICNKKGKSINLKNETIDIIINLFIKAIYYHDIGKVNPAFQIKKMNNKNIIDKDIKNSAEFINTNHSPLSASIYVNNFIKDINDINNKEEKAFAGLCLYAFSYVIYNHHGDLENFSDFIDYDNFNNKVSIFNSKPEYTVFLKDNIDIKQNPNNYIKIVTESKLEYNGYLFFIMIKLLQSSINVSDFIATGKFYNDDKNNKVSIKVINNITDIKKDYYNHEIYKSNMKYADDKTDVTISPINKLRSKMFLEATENLSKNYDSNIYLLEMPTGAGKTFTSINLTLDTIDYSGQDKLVYVFPFNTLVDQTKQVLDDAIKNSIDFEVINSIYPIDDSSKDYSDILLNRQMWNYEGIITSHVSLFEVLISGKREASLAFLNLMDTMFVLDEIQTYKNDIWTETIEYIHTFNEVMNSKTLIMSATNPYLYSLIQKQEIKDKINVTKLIKDPSVYFQAREFKDRVIMNDSLVDSKITYPRLLLEVKKEIVLRRSLEAGNHKVLIEFIKKQSAQEFEQYLRVQYRKNKNTLILEIDGDTPLYMRKEIINRVKAEKDKDIILISTQIIEAGVDIDMDIGFKDISTIDSEEQFMGRINRSSSKSNCRAFFFDIDIESKIYRGDLRLGKTLREKKYWDIVKNKEFFKYYEEIFNIIRYINNRYDDNNLGEFYLDLKLCKFNDVYDRMKLIDTKTFSVFIPKKVIIDSKIIDGDMIWNEYMSLYDNKHMPYAEKRIKLKNMEEKLSYFTFNIYGEGLSGIDKVAGMYYIDDNSILLDEKINRDIFKEKYNIIAS